MTDDMMVRRLLCALLDAQIEETQRLARHIAEGGDWPEAMGMGKTIHHFPQQAWLDHIMKITAASASEGTGPEADLLSGLVRYERESLERLDEMVGRRLAPMMDEMRAALPPEKQRDLDRLIEQAATIEYEQPDPDQ